MKKQRALSRLKKGKFFKWPRHNWGIRGRTGAMVRGGKGVHRGGKLTDGSESSETINGYAVSYVQKLVRCSKERCKKCSTPGGGHGPYWYKVYRTADGKVKSSYIGRVKPVEAETEG
jgi:hypothetical protein